MSKYLSTCCTTTNTILIIILHNEHEFGNCQWQKKQCSWQLELHILPYCRRIFLLAETKLTIPYLYFSFRFISSQFYCIQISQFNCCKKK